MPHQQVQVSAKTIEEQIGSQLVRSFYRPLIAIAAIMAVVFLIPGVTPMPLIGLIEALGVAIIGLVAAWLSGRGRPRMAAALLVGVFIIMGVAYFFLFGWLEDQGPLILPLMVFIAGLLAGPPLALATMLLSLCLVGLALVLTHYGVEPVSLNPDNPLVNAFITAGIVILVAALIGHYAKLLRRSLRERFELERRRQEAQRLESLGRLAGGVAHDFNNLLTPILGHASLLAEDDNLDADLRKTGRQIGEAAQRASNLVVQLMAFGRQNRLKPEVLNLNLLVDKLKDILARVIRENVEQKYFQAEDLSQVRSDAGRIEQVLLNLAINASEAMPEGGRLTLETSNITLVKPQAGSLGDLPPGNYVLLSVTDTGQGMSKETLNRIYEPFFSTKQDAGGTGLGLATVYGIIRQSGGAIHVYSEPGQGTVFKVYLPAVTAEPLPQPESSAGLEEKSLTGEERVLVVDDMEQVRKVTVTILTQRGYQVLQAADGLQAQEMVSNLESPIQLLVTDLIMPNMGGRDLARALRKQNPDLKVVFISGYGENGISDSDEQLPNGLFLMKPFTAMQLLEKVREALDD